MKKSLSANVLKVVLSVLVLQFSSCLSKEDPVPLKPQGDLETGQVEMGEMYSWQVYYSLKNHTEVGKNRITEWDLGFECGDDGWHVIINGAKISSYVYNTGKTNFEGVTIKDTVGVAAEFDTPNGVLDSTAVGDWREKSPVYILDRGSDEYVKKLGFAKFQVLSVTSTGYKVRISGIGGENQKDIDIAKDDTYNFSFLSFDEGGKVVKIEPPKRDWDIVFTKYTHYYHDLEMSYSVTGCVLNRYMASAALLDTSFKDFEAISLQSLVPVKLTTDINVIGFDWKYYDFNESRFILRNQRFAIKSGEDELYYKLRFIDFYKAGVKGAPQFEYQRL